MKELSLIEKSFFLKKQLLFDGLNLELLLAIADKMLQDDYDYDEKVFIKNQSANRMYFIVHGSVEIYDMEDTKPVILKKNQFFGEESLFSGEPRFYSATCITETVFLTLSRTNLMTIISECPSIAISFLESFSKNLPCRLLKN